MTKEQLALLWETQFEFGLPNGYDRGSEHTGHIPTSSPRLPFTGEAIGTIGYNPETGDLRVTPYGDDEKLSQKPTARQPE